MLPSAVPNYAQALQVARTSFTPTCSCVIRRLSSPTLRLRPGQRHFSFGSKHKWGANLQGKMVAEKIKKAMISRSGARYPYFERQLLLRRCLPAEGWRSASHWRNSQSIWNQSSREEKSDKERSAVQEEDWYGRWERQKREQYEAFMKKIEEDPFMALFGQSNRWLGWTTESGLFNRGAKVSTSKSEPKRSTESVKLSASPKPSQSQFSKFIQMQENLKGSQPTHFHEQENQYQIDPITLRKVPGQDQNMPVHQSTETPRTHDIPVKTFQTKPAKDTPAKDDNTTSPTINETKPQGWLEAEGFVKQGKPSAPAMTPETTSQETRASKGSKIESALDRHLRRKALSEPTSSTLEYDPKENQKEDIDLLRASDVRASAGTRGRKPTNDPLQREVRQREMELEYEQRPAQLEKQLEQEMAQTGRTSSSQVLSNLTHTDARYMNQVSDANDVLSDQTELGRDLPSADAKGRTSDNASQKANILKTRLVPLKTRIDLMKAEYDGLRQHWLNETRRLRQKQARSLHEEEVKAQKLAMEALESRKAEVGFKQVLQSNGMADMHRGEGDVADNIHEFTGRARWYKRKAPHAKDELDAKFHQLTKERAFVRDIREIYEDTYGMIDAQHRQQPLADDTKGAESQNTSQEDISPNLLLPVKGDNSKPLSHDAPNVGQGSLFASLSTMDIQKLKALVQEIGLELSSIDELIKAQIRQGHADTATGMIIKSSAYRHKMGNVLRIASKLAHEAPACKKELIDTAISAAAISWQASLALVNRQLATAKGKVSIEPVAPGSKTPTDAAAEDLAATTPAPANYRILAYDVSTQRLTSAKTTSSNFFDNKKPLKPLEALTLLQNPGKFLPQLVSLHNKGYDVVSGAPNILVLKKVRHSQVSEDEGGPRPYRTNPIDGTMSSTGNYASPTGFVNYDSVLTPEELEQLIKEQQESRGNVQADRTSESNPDMDPTASSASARIDSSATTPHPSDKVRREEAVFSGRRRGGWEDANQGKRFNWKKHRRAARRRRTLKRMILTGTLTAAFCYAVGVAIEFMRV